MGLTNFPPAGKISNDAGISTLAEATATNPPGAFYGYTDSSGRWSVVRYYRAAASIRQGAPLIHDTAVRTDYQLKESAIAQVELGETCKGIAAASVSNTSYYSFAYIAGYVPDVQFPSTHVGHSPYRLSTSLAGRLQAMLNATYGSSTSPKNPLAVVLSLGSQADSGTLTSSGLIVGWLL